MVLLLAWAPLSATNGSGYGFVSITPNHTVQAESPFHFEDKVHFDLNVGDTSRSFEHVHFCLLSENGSTILARDIGTLSNSSPVRNVSVTADEVPFYITVHHPGFGTIDDFHPEVMSYRPEEDIFGEGAGQNTPFHYRLTSDTTCPSKR